MSIKDDLPKFEHIGGRKRPKPAQWLITWTTGSSKTWH